MLLRACRMAANMSSNFSCPEVSSVTLLLCVNTTPSFSKACLITVSLLCSISDTATSKIILNFINSLTPKITSSCVPIGIPMATCQTYP